VGSEGVTLELVEDAPAVGLGPGVDQDVADQVDVDRVAGATAELEDVVA
jgi:hypothetical protein